MRKIILSLLLLILALPLSAQAHTVLTSSNPAEGEVIEETLKEVQLAFGTAIEQESTMVLQREGEAYEFQEILVSGNNMTGRINEELPNGPYTIQWKIIGADGHPIEGEIPFALNTEITEEPVMENEETADEDSANEAEGTSNEEPIVEEEQINEQAAAGGEESNALVMVLIVIAGLLAVVGLFTLFKKKQ